MRVVPADHGDQFLPHSPDVQRNQDPPEPFGFQTPDEPLDHGDTAVLSNGAESRPDLAATAPAFEALALELAALVADDVLWCGLGIADGCGQGVADLPAGRLLAEDSGAHHPS